MPDSVCEQFRAWTLEAVEEWDGVDNGDLLRLIAEKQGITVDDLVGSAVPAVPELLAACEEFIRYDVMEHPGQDDPLTPERIGRRIRLAVDRARGREVPA